MRRRNCAGIRNTPQTRKFTMRLFIGIITLFLLAGCQTVSNKLELNPASIPQFNGNEVVLSVSSKEPSELTTAFKRALVDELEGFGRKIVSEGPAQEAAQLGVVIDFTAVNPVYMVGYNSKSYVPNVPRTILRITMSKGDSEPYYAEDTITQSKVYGLTTESYEGMQPLRELIDETAAMIALNFMNFNQPTQPLTGEWFSIDTAGRNARLPNVIIEETADGTKFQSRVLNITESAAGFGFKSGDIGALIEKTPRMIGNQANYPAKVRVRYLDDGDKWESSTYAVTGCVLVTIPKRKDQTRGYLYKANGSGCYY